MARVEVRAATLADIPRITARDQDRTELWDGFHHTPDQALEFGIAEGAWYFELDGEPGGVFGCVADPSGWAVPWAIFTQAIERHPFTFAKGSREPIESMKKTHRRLVNFVDARNTLVIRWLKWNGFTVYPARAFGVEQRLFHRFDHVQS